MLLLDSLIEHGHATCSITTTSLRRSWRESKQAFSGRRIKTRDGVYVFVGRGAFSAPLDESRLTPPETPHPLGVVGMLNTFGEVGVAIPMYVSLSIWEDDASRLNGYPYACIRVLIESKGNYGEISTTPMIMLVKANRLP